MQARSLQLCHFCTSEMELMFSLIVCIAYSNKQQNATDHAASNHREDTTCRGYQAGIKLMQV